MNYQKERTAKSNCFAHPHQLHSSTHSNAPPPNPHTCFTPCRFTQLLSGSGWLVRKGKSYVNQSADIDPNSGFATEKAPRTAIGLMHDGSLVSVAVDGVEKTKQGPGLAEFAELLVALGAREAMNLDGGGSTTAVYKGQVFNVPTCHDTPDPCQRDVTTITCIKH